MPIDQDGIDDLANDGIVVDDKNKDVVSHESFQKLLNQRKADKAKLKDAEEKLKTLEAKEKEIADKEAKIAEEKLKEDGNWKALLESREKELADLKAEKENLSESVKGFEKKFTDAHKLNAFKEAIGGTLKKDSYYTFVDTSKIALDPKTGVIDEKSLKSYANDFVTEHKELIQFKSGAKLPGDAPKHTGSLSYDEWLKLAKTNPKEARERQKDVK